MDRENIDIAVCHIPGHHGYLQDLQLLSRHHRSVNLAKNPSASRRMKRMMMMAYLLDAPVKVILDMCLDLLLALVGKAQSFKGIVQVDEPFRDDIGAVLAVGTMFGIGVHKLAVAANEVRRQTPLGDVVGNCTEEKEDSEALPKLELLDTDANEPIETLKGGKGLWSGVGRSVGGASWMTRSCLNTDGRLRDSCCFRYRCCFKDSLWSSRRLRWGCGFGRSSGRSSLYATADRCESPSGLHSNTTTTVVGVVQRVDLGLNLCLPFRDRETLKSHKLRIGSLELDEISDWRIGGTVERVAALPEGREV